MRKEQWEYLSDIAITKSISATAIKFHISSQALGKSMRSLEEELNFQLLIRSHTGVTLTENAKKALSFAQVFFNNLSSLENEITANANIIPLELPLTTGLYEIDFSEILQQYEAIFPNYNVQLIHMSFNKLLQNISNKSYDFGIASLLFHDKKPDTSLINSQFSVIPFKSQQVVALVSSENPLAKKKDISIIDLCKYDFIALSFDNSIQNSLLHAYDLLEVQMPAKMSFERSLNAIINRITFYNCVSLTLESNLSQLKNVPQIKILPIREKIKLKTCYIIRKDDKIENIDIPYTHLSALN